MEISRLVFTWQRHAITVYALVVCLSVTSRCSTEMAKRRIMQTMPHNSPGTLVFLCRRSRQSSDGLPPMEVPNAGGVGAVHCASSSATSGTCFQF